MWGHENAARTGQFVSFLGSAEGLSFLSWSYEGRTLYGAAGMTTNTTDRPYTESVNFDNIPPQLKALDRWVVWRWERGKGKWTKPPKRPDEQFAATSDPGTWSTFREVHAAYMIGDFDGVGIVLSEGIVGVDLNDCIGTEGMIEESKMVMAMLPTNCETSSQWHRGEVPGRRAIG